MILDINDTLSRLCAGLSGSGSGNYLADIRLYHAVGVAGRSVAEVVGASLGWPVAVERTTSADRGEVISRIKEGLEYTGDDGAHPSYAFLSSDQFRKGEEEVLRFFESFLSDAGSVFSFHLTKGHPFYPVFWDYAFLIEKGSDAFVLIGSSSD